MPSTPHNRRNHLAAAPPVPTARPALPPAQAPAFLLRAPQAFPADVIIPPHRGAVTQELAAPAAAAPEPPALFAVPEKPAAPPRKKKAAAKRRKPAKRVRAVKGRGAKKTGTATPSAAVAPTHGETIFAMPPLAEPLVDDRTPMPREVQPLPRSRALARPPRGGMLGAIAQWIGSGLIWLIESGPRPAPAKGMAPRQRAQQRASTDEMARLRAENENLRLQLEALLALQERRSAAPARPA